MVVGLLPDLSRDDILVSTGGAHRVVRRTSGGRIVSGRLLSHQCTGYFHLVLVFLTKDVTSQTLGEVAEWSNAPDC